MTPKVKIAVYSLRRQTEAAVRRATALPRLFRATIQTNGRLRMASLAAFAPARAQLLLPNQLLPLPFEPKDNKMYRGMVLAADRKDLRYILQNG